MTPISLGRLSVGINHWAISDLHHLIQVGAGHIFEMLSVARSDRQRHGNTVADAKGLFCRKGCQTDIKANMEELADMRGHTKDAIIKRSSAMSRPKSRILVPSRDKTLKIITTKRHHVVTLTTGSLVSPLNRVPIDAECKKKKNLDVKQKRYRYW